MAPAALDESRAARVFKATSSRACCHRLYTAAHYATLRTARQVAPLNSHPRRPPRAASSLSLAPAASDGSPAPLCLSLPLSLSAPNSTGQHRTVSSSPRTAPNSTGQPRTAPNSTEPHRTALNGISLLFPSLCLSLSLSFAAPTQYRTAPSSTEQSGAAPNSTEQPRTVSNLPCSPAPFAVQIRGFSVRHHVALEPLDSS